jgi:hypothetical protein
MTYPGFHRIAGGNPVAQLVHAHVFDIAPAKLLL